MGSVAGEVVGAVVGEVVWYVEGEVVDLVQVAALVLIVRNLQNRSCNLKTTKKYKNNPTNALAVLQRSCRKPGML